MTDIEVKHALGIASLGRGDLEDLLCSALSYSAQLKEVEPLGWRIRRGQKPEAPRCIDSTLKGVEVGLLCWPVESKRHKNKLHSSHDGYVMKSFSRATSYLCGDAVNATPDPAESLKDVVRSVLVMGGESLRALVIRNKNSGVPQQISEMDCIRDAGIAVINGGDGIHEDPSEALVYLSMLWKENRSIEGLRVLLVGDFNFNPVGRSLLFALEKLGAQLEVFAPEALVPYTQGKVAICRKASDVGLNYDIIIAVPVPEDIFRKNIVPSKEEYRSFFSLSSLREQVKLNKCRILWCRHSLDIEAVNVYDDSESSWISAEKPSESQEVAARMAVLKYCLCS